MARKSRVNIEVKEEVLVPKSERIPTAIYARLSIENRGQSEDKDVIRNQIEICNAYVSENPDFDLVETYIENGRSGTNFDRPEFNRLMGDIKSGKIKCLVVRDLSRFGRDYIEAGTYLERIFPNIGVRFISVNERYDSFTTDKTNEALMIPLQNMINALYSKDLSRKVSSALKTQMKEGTMKKYNPPYGYMWNEDRTQVIVDEEAAKFVRLMFKWKLEGVSADEMCARLDDMNAPSARYRKYQNGIISSEKNKCNFNVKWVKSTVTRILQNPCYVGDLVHGRTETAKYKGVKTHTVYDEEQWIVYSDKHEAIVSRDEFEEVKKILDFSSSERKRKLKESEKARAKLTDLFDGKIFCADCGRRMYFGRVNTSHAMNKPSNKWRGTYRCASTAIRTVETCKSRYLQQDHINEKILSAIVTQVKVALDYEKLLLKLKDSEGERSIRDKQNALISSLNLKLNGVQQKRTRLYEDFSEGILNEEEYTFAKISYDDDFARLNLQLEEAVKRKVDFNDAMSSNNKWIQLMKSVSKAKKLTQALVDESIEKVLVYEGGDIELIMKYADIYAFTVSCTKDVENEVAL